MKNSPKNIVVIKFCGIGDLIFLMPMLDTIRRTYPHATVTMVTSVWVKELIACIHSIDTCVVSNAPYETSLWKKSIALLSLIRKIRDLRPDIAIVGHRNSFFGFLALLSGARIRLGFVGTKFLTLTCKFDSSLHEMDRYMAIPALLGMKESGNGINLTSLSSERNSAQEKLSHFSIPQDEQIVIIFPGGGENPGTSMTIKRWPSMCYIQLLQKMRINYSYSIVLVGSEEENQLCEGIANKVEGVYNLAGMFSLGEMVALGARCILFIGGDSGPTHLIAATGAPTISLFGPSDPRLVAPRGRQQVYLWKQPFCAPCYTPETVVKRQYFEGKTFMCHTGTLECLKSLTVEEVWEVAVKMLSSKTRNTTVHD